jgi:ubiquinone/menaquinone biosynthesis C-methylase UbiE
MSAALSAVPGAVDLEAIKARQQSAWSAGDYAVVGTTLQIVGETLCEALDLRSGQVVLDVAAGNGNATLAAARRWCDVTSTDYVPSLLEAGRRRAEAEGHQVRFLEADAERLPFADGSFDAVLSIFGVMFTADHARAAAELTRVCRRGGRIGLANWTPDSFIGQVFRIIGRYISPPGIASPASWGTIEKLQELFAPTAHHIHAERKEFVFRYRSPAHLIHVFRTFYGPMYKTFAALDAHKQETFAQDLTTLMATRNRASDGTVVVPSEYLEVVIERK